MPAALRFWRYPACRLSLALSAAAPSRCRSSIKAGRLTTQHLHRRQLALLVGVLQYALISVGYASAPRPHGRRPLSCGRIRLPAIQTSRRSRA